MENKKDIIVCECNSPEHQIVIYYDEDDNENMCYLHVHLNRRPFWSRLIYGIRYIFGRKCRFGAFEEFIFNPDDGEKLQNLVNYLNRGK